MPAACFLNALLRVSSQSMGDVLLLQVKKCHSVQNFIAVLLPALTSPDYHGVMRQGLPTLGSDSGRAGICRELFKY